MFRCMLLNLFCGRTVPRSLAPYKAQNKRSDKQKDKYEEQNFRDLDGASSDSRKAKQRSNQRDNKKHDGIMKHFLFLLRYVAPRIQSR